MQTLAREGRLAVHGIALTPGETAALGFVGDAPGAAAAGAARRRAGGLAGGRPAHAGAARRQPAKASRPRPSTLTRKVASTVGLAEFVPVRRVGDGVEPLAAKYLPLSALARSDGWILVPADSEGYSAGAQVRGEAVAMRIVA